MPYIEEDLGVDRCALSPFTQSVQKGSKPSPTMDPMPCPSEKMAIALACPAWSQTSPIMLFSPTGLPMNIAGKVRDSMAATYDVEDP